MGVAVGGGVAVGVSVAVGSAVAVAGAIVGVSVGTAVFVGSSSSPPASAVIPGTGSTGVSTGVSAGVSAGISAWGVLLSTPVKDAPADSMAWRIRPAVSVITPAWGSGSSIVIVAVVPESSEPVCVGGVTAPSAAVAVTTGVSVGAGVFATVAVGIGV